MHLTNAAPGHAAALAKELSQPDPNAPMPDHFMVLRHQEGDDWDYAVIPASGSEADRHRYRARASGDAGPAHSVTQSVEHHGA